MELTILVEGFIIFLNMQSVSVEEEFLTFYILTQYAYFGPALN